MALGCDITELSPHHRSGGVMWPGQWVWVWMWLLRLGPLESGEKLGRVGRRKAGDWGQCRDQSRPRPPPPPPPPEAGRPQLGSSLCSPHFSPILPAQRRPSPGGLSQPLRSSGNKIKALHSYTKAVWPGRALGLSQTRVGFRALLGSFIDFALCPQHPVWRVPRPRAGEQHLRSS